MLVPLESRAESYLIREVRVDGVQRIEPSTVMSYLNLRVGDRVDQEGLDSALKGLFATGLFADVTLRHEKRVLYVDVVENPVINRIAFEGNEQFEDDELRAEIALRPRQIFTRTKAQNDVSRIYQVYRRNGYFAASVDPKIIRLDQNRVDLVFEVAEGHETSLRGIRFVGNRHFDDDKLKSEISSKESRWYRFFNSDDRYDPDRVAFDQELLRQFYLQEGYADFRVISAVAELSQDQEFFYLTFTVDEGQRYRVGTVNIDSSLRGFDSSVLQGDITIEPGDWYDASEVRTSSDGMVDTLGDLQYAFVDVRPRTDTDKEGLLVDVTFGIRESPRVFVERVDINGNVRTLDEVIRREILLVEGDPFSKSKLARTEQKIRDLGYFEAVNIKNLPGSAPDKTVIDVSVAEQSTGELSLGAGFSTSDGPLADLRLRERNFLGKGQDLLFSTTVAGERTQFDASFTEPYFLGRDLRAGIDAFHVTRDFQDESSFDQRRTGGALRIGYPLSEKIRQTIRYRYERNEIQDVQSSASRFVREQEGVRDTSAISQRLVFDDRDSSLFPTEGFYGWLDSEFAGIGGDASYVSGKLGGNYYYPVYERSVIFNVLGEVGGIEGIDDDVRINERYYLGGNKLRGFENSGIGPRDIQTDDALGGKYFYRASAELSFPIGFSEELGVSGHAFTDAGSLFDVDDNNDPNLVDEESIRAAAGLGISWRSPLGPVRVDVALPYLDEDFDKEENFRFSFGTRL